MAGKPSWRVTSVCGSGQVLVGSSLFYKSSGCGSQGGRGVSPRDGRCGGAWVDLVGLLQEAKGLMNPCC